MTTVDDIIPVKPGDIYAAASYYANLKTDLMQVADSLKQVPGSAPTWSGSSQSAFEAKALELAADLTNQANIAGDADTFLHTVAEIFTEYRAVAADLVDDLERYKDDPANPALVQEDVNELRTAGKNVADRAGTELEGLADGYSESVTPGGGTESTDPDLQPVQLSREENLMLYALLQGEGASNYNEINQRGIGNCYLLASIISMMSSDEGADFLRESIRPVFSEDDGEIIGWEVRVYEPDDWWNPFDSDKETWQTVTQRYSDPAVGSSQPESVAWLLERAYGQMIGHDESEGGWPEDSYEHLIGGDSTVIRGDRVPGWQFWDSKNYSESERQEIIDAINNQRPVAAETASQPKDNGHWYWVGEGDDGSHMSDVPVHLDGPNGQEATIKLYGAHAYAVVDADENGVTMVNPHGWNPVVDQGVSTNSGQFYITWEEFEDRFGSVAVGSDYGN